MTGKATIDGQPDPVDVYAGKKLRERRLALNMSQEHLADVANVSFQQVQKYEKGANRISVSRLMQFARALDVAPAYFFPEGPAEVPKVDLRDRAAQQAYDAYRRRNLRLPAWEDLHTDNPFDAAIMAAALELADALLARPKPLTAVA